MPIGRDPSAPFSGPTPGPNLQDAGGTEKGLEGLVPFGGLITTLEPTHRSVSTPSGALNQDDVAALDKSRVRGQEYEFPRVLGPRRPYIPLKSTLPGKPAHPCDGRIRPS